MSTTCFGVEAVRELGEADDVGEQDRCGRAFAAERDAAGRAHQLLDDVRREIARERVADRAALLDVGGVQAFELAAFGEVGDGDRPAVRAGAVGEVERGGAHFELQGAARRVVRFELRRLRRHQVVARGSS